MPPIPARSYTDIEDVLRFYLAHSPPDHALWKSVEWRLFREYEYPDPVLDLGCGDGVFARLVFGRPLAAGIDRLHGRVRQARAADVYKLALTGDATAMPFAENSFGTVFSGCAMEHVPQMPDMLREIHRILRPGGCLITTVPSGYFGDYLLLSGVLRRWGLTTLARGYGASVARLLTMIHLYQPAHWSGLLDVAGLQLVESRYFLAPEAMEVFDQVLIIGNILQPLLALLRGTSLHRRYVERMSRLLIPLLGSEAATGGALLLVAQKPEATP